MTRAIDYVATLSKFRCQRSGLAGAAFIHESVEESPLEFRPEREQAAVLALQALAEREIVVRGAIGGIEREDFAIGRSRFGKTLAGFE